MEFNKNENEFDEVSKKEQSFMATKLIKDGDIKDIPGQLANTMNSPLNSMPLH